MTLRFLCCGGVVFYKIRSAPEMIAEVVKDAPQGNMVPNTAQDVCDFGAWLRDQGVVIEVLVNPAVPPDPALDFEVPAAGLTFDGVMARSREASLELRRRSEVLLLVPSGQADDE